MSLTQVYRTMQKWVNVFLVVACKIQLKWRSTADQQPDMKVHCDTPSELHH